MGRRRWWLGVNKRKSRPSDHDPKAREETIALALLVGVNFESPQNNEIYGYFYSEDGRIISSPFFQQRYMVAEWFVDVLNLREKSE